MPFDLATLDHRAFNGYGAAPIPDDRDEDIRRYVEQLEADGSASVAEASEAATERMRSILRAFAERAASRAVREGNARWLSAAVIAVVMGGLFRFEREALMVMPLIEDAATRLNLNLSSLFERGSRVVGHQGTVALASWLSRDADNRTLECMGFVTSEDGSGFRYEFRG